MGGTEHARPGNFSGGIPFAMVVMAFLLILIPPPMISVEWGGYGESIRALLGGHIQCSGCLRGWRGSG